MQHYISVCNKTLIHNRVILLMKLTCLASFQLEYTMKQQECAALNTSGIPVFGWVIPVLHASNCGSWSFAKLTNAAHMLVSLLTVATR